MPGSANPTNWTLSMTTSLSRPPNPKRSKYRVATVPAGKSARSTVTTKGWL